MLKIVYPICCGMDVHKSFIVACIATTNEQGVTTYISKRFSTFTGDLRRCAEWLALHNCGDVCMESTGKYWIPIYNILEPTCKIVLAHLSSWMMSFRMYSVKLLLPLQQDCWKILPRRLPMFPVFALKA